MLTYLLKNFVVLDKMRNFVCIYLFLHNLMMQAMIFAAGLGTRLKPLTDTMPKALVKVGGEPLIEHVVRRLADAGFKRIVVNVHHFSSQIIDFLREKENFGLDIIISDESDRLLDTGGGIKKAAPLFDHEYPILIHNVDIFSNVDLHQFYEASQNRESIDKSCIKDKVSETAVSETALSSVLDCLPIDAVLLVSQRKTKRYLLFDNDMTLVGWNNVETGEVRSPYGEIDSRKYQMYAFAGIHVISPRLVNVMDEFPDKFGIIDFYLKTCATHRIVGFVKNDLSLMDIGKLDTLSQAEAFLKSLNDHKI